MVYNVVQRLVDENLLGDRISSLARRRLGLVLTREYRRILRGNLDDVSCGGPYEVQVRS